MNSQLILDNAIVRDEWITVESPTITTEVRKQAGKVVMFKLTGEDTLSEEQIMATALPKNGKFCCLPRSTYNTKTY